jgi:hypothetical protein
MPTMKIIPAAVLLAGLAIACNSTSNNEAKLNSASDRMERPEAADSAVSYGSPEIPGNQLPSNAPKPEDQQPSPKQNRPATVNGQLQPASNPDWDRKIVKTAGLNVEVKNFKDFTVQLHEKVRAAGGYIAQEEQNESPYKIENTVTIKVPVDRFDETVLRLVSDSDKVVSKKISSEDVTMQVIDTKSRLETKKQLRERYLDMLKQARSKADVLDLQREVDNIQTDIEGAAGRVAYLGHAAAYSTINLSFYQILDVTVKEETQPGFAHRLRNAFREGWGWVSILLVGLVELWPVLLAGVLGLIWWRKRPRTSAKSSVS